jgi:Arylsulfotransferase (ASST)
VALAGTAGCGPVERARARASSAAPGQAWNFRSRPDLHPPVITVRAQARDTAPGYVFVAPKNGPDEDGPGQDGCMILDNEGQPVWLHLLADESLDVMDFKMQTYKGEPVLTWWVGHHTGYGQGEYVILDRAYREVKRFGAGNGYQGDHHEFLITSEGTALITIYNKVPMDTSSMGGSADGNVLDGIAQEIDIETGEVLFEWHSLKHVGLDESYSSKPYDYFHINSVDVYDDEHVLISSRNTWTLYKVSRKTGEVVWRFGGKKSDFEMGERTRTAYQHDARWHGDGTITVFDNGGGPWVHEQSRAIRVELDEDAMKASLLASTPIRASCAPPPRAACRSCRAATFSSAGAARRCCRSFPTAASSSSTPTFRPKANPTGPSACHGRATRKRPRLSSPNPEKETS